MKAFLRVLREYWLWMLLPVLFVLALLAVLLLTDPEGSSAFRYTLFGLVLG